MEDPSFKCSSASQEEGKSHDGWLVPETERSNHKDQDLVPDRCFLVSFHGV